MPLLNDTNNKKISFNLSFFWNSLGINSWELIKKGLLWKSIRM